MQNAKQLNLLPPLYEDLDDFLGSGRTISFAVSPVANSLATFAAPFQYDPRAGFVSNEPQDQDVYIVSWDKAPTSERRLLITDTSLIFAAFQNFVNNTKEDTLTQMRSPQDIATFRKLTGDYITHIQECWVHASQSVVRTDGPPQFPGEHYRSLYTSLSLFQTLYLPEEGIEDVPVGDELLEWLNIHFIEPSTEEGDHLSSLEHPWEDESFWPYLIRSTLRGLSKSSIFFLQSLSRHPSEDLQRISERYVSILAKHPRQSHFSTEKEFSTASRRWKDRAKALRLELDRVPDDSRHDGFDNWWDYLSDLLGVLEGRGEELQRVCVELGGDWKEVVCTWGVWIDVGLRRSELPDLVGKVTFDLPPDPTDKEDALHAELFQGHPIQSLALSHDIDLWLAAHMADIMVPLGLLDSDIDEESNLTVRDQYVLSYAEYLLSDPALWRLTVDYMCTCGEIGKEMADEVLIRVPLRLDQPRQHKKGTGHHEGKSTRPDDDMEVEEGDLAGVVKELNATCYEYQREPLRRIICKIASQNLVRLKKYGLAISYCKSAEDWPGLGYIVDRVLEEYISHGPFQFASLVADIAPSLQELRAEPGPHRVFVHRLMFAVRYAEFHQRKMKGDSEDAALDLVSMFEEELAPKSWWGVLLNDVTPFVETTNDLYFSSNTACLLLHRLEEVTIRTNHGCGEDYLSILARTLKVSGVKEALKRLDILRLALARYIARCVLHGPVSGEARKDVE